MIKKIKLIIVGIILLTAGYVGLYYHATHGFDADLQLDLFIAKCVADKFKTDEEQKKYMSERMELSKKCEPSNYTCRDEIGFFINPYKRKKSLISCQTLILSVFVSKVINTPKFDCEKKYG